MTELQRLYVAERERGLGHHAAMRALAKQLDVDKATVERNLQRAEKERGRAWVDEPGRAS